MFHPYLLSHRYIVYTDCSACASLLNQWHSHVSAKLLGSLALVIQEWTIDIDLAKLITMLMHCQEILSKLSLLRLNLIQSELP